MTGLPVMGLGEIVWQFNEAVSLLREAYTRRMNAELMDAIGETLPAIQAALVAAAAVVPDPSDNDPAHTAAEAIIAEHDGPESWEAS